MRSSSRRPPSPQKDLQTPDQRGVVASAAERLLASAALVLCFGLHRQRRSLGLVIEAPALICVVGCFVRTWRASARTPHELRGNQPAAHTVGTHLLELPSAMLSTALPKPHRPDGNARSTNVREPHAPGMEQEITRRAKRRSGPTGRPPSETATTQIYCPSLATSPRSA